MEDRCSIHEDFDIDCEQCCAIIDRFMEENQDLDCYLDVDDSEE